MKKIVCLLVMALLFFPCSNVTSAQNTNSSISQKAINYLTNSYNTTLHLIPETNNSRTYWLVSDNLLAGYALKDHNNSVSSEIDNTLKSYAVKYNLPVDSSGLPISYKHEALIGDVLPNVFRNSSEQNGYSLFNGSDYLLVTEVNNFTQMNDWENYADLLALRGISLFNQGNISGSTHYYNALFTDGMWNGYGFADIVYNASQVYSVYKLGLAIILSNRLGIINSSLNEQMVNVIKTCQINDGGIRTDYTVDGSSIIPSGSANTETTSIIAIANPTTESSIPEFSSLIVLPLFISVLFVSILIGIRKDKIKNVRKLPDNYALSVKLIVSNRKRKPQVVI